MTLDELFKDIEDKYKPENAYDEDEYLDYPGEKQDFGEPYDPRIDDR